MDLIKASDTLMIGTPEGEIKSVWDCIVKALREAENDLNCKSIFYVCHFSGSQSSDVFSAGRNWALKPVLFTQLSVQQQIHGL